MAEILPLGPLETNALWIADEAVALPLAVDHLDIAAQDEDLLLILLASGGTACPKMWVYLDAGADPLWVSEPFGTCHDDAQAFRTERGIEVISPATDLGQSGDVRYWLEGHEVHEAQAPLKSLGFTQVTQWEGMHPKRLVDDPAWEAWFLKRVGPVGLLELRGLFEQASLFFWDGDWLVAEGCKADACDELRGVLMLHKDGDRVSAAVQRKNGNIQQPMLLMASEDNDVIQAFIRMYEAQDE
ncbi:hypothetical protein [Celeribacter neptunius]|uniref:hypothetical protein n=1 Tax=Celeribacter neptunius TaxID=588602 RepID=UPI001160D0D0|nr:hypothetical protein [Celeribacter neptunius]